MRAECCSITGLAGKMEFQRTHLEEEDKSDVGWLCSCHFGTTRAFKMDTSAAWIALGEIIFTQVKKVAASDRKK